MNGTLAQFGLSPDIALDAVDRNLAGVWRGELFERGAVVSGRPRLNLTVVPATADLTLIGILYDEGPDGLGRAITYWPLTRHGLTSSAPVGLSWELEPTYWNLAPGHRLTLTVTSQDPVPFQSSTPLGGTVVFASPSTVELPVTG